MIILGTKPVQHDACFALVRDGEPLFIYEQERFNRIKHGMSSHLSVLFEALDEYSIAPHQIDLVTNCIDPSRLEARKRQARGYLSGPDAEDMERYLDWRIPTWHKSLLAAGFPADRVVNIPHHICHCAGVYYASPFDDSAILSVDGSGETETSMLAHGSGNDITVLRTTPLPQSLGLFYQGATMWLGWGFGEEGKTMALAAYGDPARCRAALDAFIRVDDTGAYAFLPARRRGGNRYTSAELAATVFTRSFGPPRRPEEPLTSLHQDVAAAVQAICEEIMLNSARYLKAATGSANLLITGGVALNSAANGRIMHSGTFDRIDVYPQANDSGTALGGALYAYHRLSGSERPRRWRITHPYWGREVDLENLPDVAARHGQRGVHVGDQEAAAELLAGGRILGWVQGRSEVGPRALGNRSILGNPLAPDIKRRINDGIKHRENWRPFAPSVLREDLAEYFEADQDLPYMTVVAPVREEWRDKLASVGHVDGTARVQTVTEESNPRFYALLKAFKRRTGLGVLLNTSFNDRGEPLVQTCEQAFRLYLTSTMDALCIGDWLFTDKEPHSPVQPFAPYLDNFARIPTGRLALVEPAGPMPEPMKAHLMSRAEVHPVTMSEVLAEAASHRWDGVLCYLGGTADLFVFDRDLYFSDCADASRRLMEEAGLPVHWIDGWGDVTPARDVLYLHHRSFRCPVPATYERYWA
ncbi:carbamoyltransferase C-terminal domain-containing protein [Streptomyces sp. NPDC048506]|uniref:carbamoyltransferase family protein n=1 Tax=Streptomyces sp. NPDC048506 TaxID=3155028 RepID=UPI00343234DD